MCGVTPCLTMVLSSLAVIDCNEPEVNDVRAHSDLHRRAARACSAWSMTNSCPALHSGQPPCHSAIARVGPDFLQHNSQCFKLRCVADHKSPSP